MNINSVSMQNNMPVQSKTNDAAVQKNANQEANTKDTFTTSEASKESKFKIPFALKAVATAAVGGAGGGLLGSGIASLMGLGSIGTGVAIGVGATIGAPVLLSGLAVSTALMGFMDMWGNK